MRQLILDACCGPRQMWFDKKFPGVVFGDKRDESIIAAGNPKKENDSKYVINVHPDVLFDFRNMPFKNNQFKLVVFDPPHLIHVGNTHWLLHKYGRIEENWRDDLRLGFSECFRVLEDKGILIFKWSEVQIKLSEILKLTNEKPLFGHRSGKNMKTHWLTFMKNADI